MTKLTETILALIVILAALLIFKAVVKPALEDVTKGTVKSIGAPRVTNVAGLHFGRIAIR